MHGWVSIIVIQPNTILLLICKTLFSLDFGTKRQIFLTKDSRRPERPRMHLTSR